MPRYEDRGGKGGGREPRWRGVAGSGVMRGPFCSKYVIGMTDVGGSRLVGVVVY